MRLGIGQSGQVGNATGDTGDALAVDLLVGGECSGVEGLGFRVRGEDLHWLFFLLSSGGPTSGGGEPSPLSGLLPVGIGGGRGLTSCRGAEKITKDWAIHISGVDVIGIQHAEVGDPAYHQMLWSLRLTAYPGRRK